jgi:hypothetical protein
MRHLDLADRGLPCTAAVNLARFCERPRAEGANQHGEGIGSLGGGSWTKLDSGVWR